MREKSKVSDIKKTKVVKNITTFAFSSRDEATRTPDPYVPNVVRYQLRYIPILRVQSYCYFLKYVQKRRFFLLFMLTVVFAELLEFIALANKHRLFWCIVYNIEQALERTELRRLAIILSHVVGCLFVPLVGCPQFGG